MVLQLASILQYVCRLAFHERPPLPHYTATWDVHTVVQYLGLTTALPLKLLAFKLVMLLALTRPSHSADLAPTQLNRRQFRPEELSGIPASCISKAISSGEAPKGVLLPFISPQFSSLSG